MDALNYMPVVRSEPAKVEGFRYLLVPASRTASPPRT